MSNVPANPSEPVSVVVAGDVCLDVLGLPIPPSPKNGQATEENWRQTGETRTFYRRGGAWLLADFVEAALKHARPGSQVIQPIAPHAKTDEERERLTRHEIVHSLLDLRVFTDKVKNKEECNCEVVRTRVFESHGFSGPNKPSDPTKPNYPTLELKLQGDVSNPELIVLDDTGNRFRHQQNLWPTGITSKAVAPALPPLVLYKLHRPLPPVTNELWQAIRAEHGHNTIVVVSVDDLREAGAVISRRLSWERTALELVWQLNGSSGSDRLAELRRCPHLIVRLGLEGAVYWRNPGGGQPPRAWLVYDPTEIEGDWDDQHAGTMVGYGSAFVAGLAATLLAPDSLEEFKRLRDGTALTVGGSLSESLPQLERGLKRGLLAGRELLSIGYGTPLKGQAPSPSYLVNDVFATWTDAETMAKAESRFATISIPISIDELDADPLGWSILNTRLDNGHLVDHVAQVVTCWKKPNSHPDIGATLATLPVGVFGKLVTYDRGEIEAYRAVSNLVREYLSQLAPKRPLCLAVFGPPGSGKSFGVEEVSASIAQRSGAKIKKLTFNLSQFSPDGEDLSRALHLVRDEVLKGNVPLVFFDEFDASVGETERYWLKKLLAPMQDGEFLDQGAIHPLGRAIFVFAGGTAHSYEKFVPTVRSENGTETDAWKQFVKAKGPDFISRLRGVLDIPGIDFDPSSPSAASALRRAGILRFQLKEKARHLFDTNETLQIDEGVLRAFLKVRRFQHGIRSLEAILDMSQLGGSTRFDAGSLPHPKQLELHVVPQTKAARPADIGFLNLVHHEPPFPLERREKIAQAIHENYLTQRRAKNEHKPEKASHQEWANLNEFYRDSNRAQADDIPCKLNSNGYRIVDADSAEAVSAITILPDELIEKLAQREHDRWVNEYEGQGWRFGTPEDNVKKLHPALLKWNAPDPARELRDIEKDKDREAMRALIATLSTGGYVIVK